MEKMLEIVAEYKPAQVKVARLVEAMLSTVLYINFECRTFG
jgi:hypothetical protein